MFKSILVLSCVLLIVLHEISCSSFSKNYFESSNEDAWYGSHIKKRFINNPQLKQERTSDRIDRLIKILQRNNNKVREEAINQELDEIMESLQGTFFQPKITKSLQNNWILRPGK
jgi:hypothetical protein